MIEANTPSDVLTRQSRWSSTRTIFIEPIGRSSRWATTVASSMASQWRGVVRCSSAVTVELQPWLKSSASRSGSWRARAGVATSALRFYEAHGLIRSERNARVTAAIGPTCCGVSPSSASPSGSGCRSARSPTRSGRCRRSEHRHATTGTSCRADGCRGSTSRSPRWSCFAIASTVASAADACRSIPASCTTSVTGLLAAAPAPATCSVTRSRREPSRRDGAEAGAHQVDEVVVVEGLAGRRPRSRPGWPRSARSGRRPPSTCG